MFYTHARKIPPVMYAVMTGHISAQSLNRARILRTIRSTAALCGTDAFENRVAISRAWPRAVAETRGPGHGIESNETKYYNMLIREYVSCAYA